MKPLEEVSQAIEESLLSLAIARNMVGGVTHFCQIGSASFFLWKNSYHTYAPLAHVGLEGLLGDWKVPMGALEAQNPLVLALAPVQGIVKEKAAPEVRAAMEAIRSEICFPLYGHNRLLAIFSVGAKINNQAFSDQEYQDLKFLADRAAKRLALTYFLEERTLFSGTTAHDLVQGFKWIPSHCQQLLDEKAGPLTPEQKTLVQELAKGFEDLRTGLGRLFDVSVFYSRLTNDPRSWGTLEVGELLKSVANPFAKTLKSQISLEIELPPAPIYIQAHQESLELALRQILDNAERFTQSGKISLKASPNGKSVKISVEDTGCGIAPPKLATLLQPLHPANRSQDPRHPGWGLLVARETLEFHGGRLQIESQENKGTKVILTLPLASGKSHA